MESVTEVRTLRSRSKTPLPQTNATHEKYEYKKGSNVNTIIEDNENTSIVENHISGSKIIKKTQVSYELTSSGHITTAGSGGYNSNHSYTSTSSINSPAATQIRKSIRNNRSVEINQNDINNVLEKSIESYTTPVKSSKEKFIDNLVGNDHIAYKIYKAAGEYWNKYPKTDYTYSELSPHRREIVPGVINMPNMSRRSLDKHDERVNIMAYNNPEKASYIRSRYESIKNSRKLNQNNESHRSYDSQDEVDLSEVNLNNSFRQRNYVQEEEILIKRIFTYIITSVYTSIKRVTNIFNHDGDSNIQEGYSTSYYAHLQQRDQGFFQRIGKYILSIFQKMYLLISSILILDTWLLQIQSKRNKNWFIILLLILLPLLLLSGTYFIFIEKFPIQLTFDSELFDSYKNSFLDNVDTAKIITQESFYSTKEFFLTIFNGFIEIWNENLK